MSTSQTINNKNNIVSTRLTKLLAYWKKLFFYNFNAVKKYWPLLVILQLQLGYLVFEKYFTEKNISSVIIEAKNLDIINKQKAMALQLKQLNEKFLSLQINQARVLKSAITIQDKATKTEDIVKQNSKNSIFPNEINTEVIITEQIKKHIEDSEPYHHLLEKISDNLKNHNSYVILENYSKNVPITLKEIIKNFDTIAANRVHTDAKLEIVPEWLDKIASLFKGKVEIGKNINSENSPYIMIKKALDQGDLQLALDGAAYIKNDDLIKWCEIVKARLFLEEQYKFFKEYAQNAIHHTNKDPK